MIRNLSHLDILTDYMEQLPRGVFLNARAQGKQNTMAMGWGGITFFWNTPVLVAPVRPSRYTHDMIEQSGVFTVSVPLHDMSHELRLVGTQSGRDMDKFNGHGLSADAAQAVDAPIVAECELHIECRVLSKNALLGEHTAEAVMQSAYANGDLHTLFFGEIVSVYRTK